ncbi:hypothetical protein CASFOL_000721 [Castilleja foliolosa]|uniref:Uncharacterized protein n=1 Tax=Castilleja foliolosa TaxID=1961234 RepID=A0ABD3EL01_9LAMI
MAFPHRKLISINESFSDPVLDQFCEEYCDNKKPDAICLYKCIYFCSDLCYIPPPPPPKKSPGLSLLLTISISALAAAFFLLTCYTIYKLYSNLTKRNRKKINKNVNWRARLQQCFVDSYGNEFAAAEKKKEKAKEQYEPDVLFSEFLSWIRRRGLYC